MGGKACCSGIGFGNPVSALASLFWSDLLRWPGAI